MRGGPKSIRAVMLVPIVHEGNAVGMLAAFSGSPGAFGEHSQAWMQSAAEVLATAEFLDNSARESKGVFGSHQHELDAESTADEQLAALGFKIEGWFLTQTHRSRRWWNFSAAAGATGMTLLLTPVFFTTPYVLWLLSAPASMAAVLAGHYARLLAKRAECDAPRSNLAGLALGYATGACLVLALAVMHAGS